MSAWRDIPGDPATGLLLVADHASARVPDGIVLGVPARVMDEHVAVDIGVAPLAAALCGALGCPAVLGDVSRLVVDLNREADAAGLVPAESDGHPVPGNRDLWPEARAARLALWHDYHDHLAEVIAATTPRLLLSLHSFTPRLRAGGPARPWEVGILYNRDERAARVALPLLANAGLMAGDNEPYSGRLLNATMNRHGEATGIAYLGIEVRQDLIGDPAGVAAMADLLAPVITSVMLNLFQHPFQR